MLREPSSKSSTGSVWEVEIASTGEGEILEEWNSRLSSCKSVCPKSPWSKSQMGSQGSSFTLCSSCLYLFIHINDSIVATIGHAVGDTVEAGVADKIVEMPTLSKVPMTTLL